jgi:hypothetical protein
MAAATAEGACAPEGERVMKTIGQRKAVTLAVALAAAFVAAMPSHAQTALPRDVQFRIDASAQTGDQQLFTTIQSLIAANPALAAPVAAAAASARNRLAASIAVTAAGIQPSQAMAIASAVAAAAPDAAVAIFNALAALAPDQAGTIANAVIEAVPPSTDAVVAALQLVQTASGGNMTGVPAGEQQAQIGGHAENPNQTPGAINTQVPSTS